VTDLESSGVVLQWRTLCIDDLDRIYALHVEATDRVGRPDLIRPETPDFFAKMLTTHGQMTGVFDDKGLVAYGVLQWDLSIEEDPFGPLRINRETRLAKFAGSSVRPSWWGHGLHSRLISSRIATARSLGFANAYSTSAPGNHRSWTNLIDEGFRIRALKEQYGGHLRFLLLKDLKADITFDPVEWISDEDIDGQRRLLAAGCEGFGWRHKGGSHEILFGRARR
jgi:GNAT superfamily N-acetyltransferase